MLIIFFSISYAFWRSGNFLVQFRLTGVVGKGWMVRLVSLLQKKNKEAVMFHQCFLLHTNNTNNTCQSSTLES